MDAFLASTAAAASMPRQREGRSALRVAQGRAVNANRVALMAEPTEERLDERFVAKKRLPCRVVQIECSAYCYAELTDDTPGEAVVSS